MVDQEKSRGSFVLNVHGFKPLDTNANQAATRDEPTRKFRNLFKAKSKLNVSIFPKLSSTASKSLPPQNATVRGVDSDHGPRVYVETDQITIEPGELSISLDGWYRMMLSVNFDCQKDAEDLYKHLGCTTAQRDAHTRVSAVSGNILECPKGKTVLPLNDFRKKQLDFGIEVSMYWTSTQTESILSAHNRQLRLTNQTLSSSYPTPPPGVDRPAYQLTFVYANETLPFEELVCPHGGCSRRKPTDIDGLRMHLDSWHDNFKYQAVREGVDDAGTEHWRFVCEVSDHRADQRASARADEPYDVRVLAPAQPFNQRQYLEEGNNEYQRQSRSGRSARSTKRTTSKAAVSRPDIVPFSVRRKPPEEVQEKPSRERKTYLVPSAPPGVTFFRSLSKRPLEEGESICESDDEVDGSWIELRKIAEDNKDKRLSDSARRFLQIFDPFMYNEVIDSDVYAGDAIIRFAREKGACLWQEQVADEFETKVDELLEHDIISEKVHAGCLKIVQRQKPNAQNATELSQRLAELDVEPTQTSHPSRGDSVNQGHTSNKDRKGKGKAIVTDTGHLTPVTADSDGDVEMREVSLSARLDAQETPQDEDEHGDPPYDLCLCGEDAQASSRPASVLPCNGIDCIRRYFHLECVQQHMKGPTAPVDRKKRNWTCDDCRDASETAR